MPPAPIITPEKESEEKRGEGVKNKTLEDLRILLELENPDSFNLQWIGKKDAGLETAIKKHCYERTEEGKRNYFGFIQKLGEPWASKFTHRETDPQKTIDGYLNDLRSLLEKENPESFNLDWVRKMDNRLYNGITNNCYEIIDGKRGYYTFIEKLGEPWKSKFVYKYVERDKEKNIQRAAEDLVRLLEEKKPDHFNMEWIKNNDRALFERIVSHGKEMVNDRRDFSSFIARLGEYWASKFTLRKRDQEANYKQASEELLVLLEKENPVNFSLSWIGDKNRDLERKIEKNCYEIIDGKKDYSTFISQLGSGWLEKFSHRKTEMRSDRTMENSIQEIIKKANESNPEYISPGWIDKNIIARHFLRKTLLMPNGTVAWEIIPDFLPPDLRSKWKFSPAEHRGLSERGKELEAKLREINPETFNTRWIKDNASGIHRWASVYFRKDGRINWNGLVDELPEDLRLKWRHQEQTLTFDQVINDLNSALRENRFSFLSPKIIQRNFPNIYWFITSRFRNEKENIDWQKIKDNLDEDLRGRFIVPKRFNERVPEHQYENQDELNKFFDSNRDKLYTLVAAPTSEDRKTRDGIYNGLVGLARKGNVTAELKILLYMEILVNNWIDQNEQGFLLYKYDTETLHDKLKKCIYLYDTNMKKARFVTYVYASLKKHAMKIRLRERGLDRPFKEGSRESVGDRFRLEE